MLVDGRVTNLVDLQLFGCALNQMPLLRGRDKCTILGVLEVYNWCKSNKDVKLLVERLTLGKLREHLRGSLGVTDVRKFRVAGLSEDVVDLGWCIVHAQFVEAVVKELDVILNWVEVRVHATIEVTSIVAEPHIVACLSQHH